MIEENKPAEKKVSYQRTGGNWFEHANNNNNAATTNKNSNKTPTPNRPTSAGELCCIHTVVIKLSGREKCFFFCNERIIKNMFSLLNSLGVKFVRFVFVYDITKELFLFTFSRAKGTYPTTEKVSFLLPALFHFNYLMSCFFADFPLFCKLYLLINVSYIFLYFSQSNGILPCGEEQFQRGGKKRFEQPSQGSQAPFATYW